MRIIGVINIDRRPIKQKILEWLGNRSNVYPAVTIAKGIHERLDSTSSVLCKMVKTGKLRTVSGIGKRGGNGYGNPLKYNNMADSYDE